MTLLNGTITMKPIRDNGRLIFIEYCGLDGAHYGKSVPHNKPAILDAMNELLLILLTRKPAEAWAFNAQVAKNRQEFLQVSDTIIFCPPKEA